MNTSIDACVTGAMYPNAAAPFHGKPVSSSMNATRALAPARRRPALLASAALTLLLLSACASVQPKPGFSEVQQLAGKKITQQISWNQGREEDAAVAEAVRGLLKDTLTADEAVQIALLNSPSLQAGYERLGVAQADVVQAGLLNNPVFSLSYQRAPNGVSHSKRELGVTQDFLSLLTLAPRKQLAGAAFEKAKLEAGQEILRVAAGVKTAYYTVEGDEQALELYRQVVTAAQAAAELAQRQFEAGTLSKREQRLQQAFYAQTLLDVANTEVQLASDREKLNRMLGLWGENTNWQVPRRLPEVPSTVPVFVKLESFAIAERLDVAALKRERDIVAGSLGYTKKYRFLSVLGIGFSYEKDSLDEALRGPTLELGLPLFDRSQGNIARLESQLRETERRLEALAIGIRSEAREAYTRVLAAHAAVEHFKTAVLPVQQDIVGETLKFYNGMLLGIYDLLRAKQDQVAAGRDYIGAIKNYWLAYVELERVLGGRLPDSVALSGAPPDAKDHSSQPPKDNQP
ncbi:MAG: TolC family protein [Burkholderiales bacterium]